MSKSEAMEVARDLVKPCEQLCLEGAVSGHRAAVATDLFFSGELQELYEVHRTWFDSGNTARSQFWRVFLLFCGTRRFNATMNAVQGERRMNTWLTFAEVGAIAGKSSSAVRMWVKRRTSKGEHVQVKKERGKHGEVWYIHSSEVSSFTEREGVHVQGEREPLTQGERVNTVTIEYYDAQRKLWERERDELSSGFLMYRYKFEEQERQLKLLPAPPEIVTSELQQKEIALAQAQNIIKQAQEIKERYKESLIELRKALQEEEQAKEELRARWEKATLPLWKKMLITLKMWKV